MQWIRIRIWAINWFYTILTPLEYYSEILYNTRSRKTDSRQTFNSVLTDFIMTWIIIIIISVCQTVNQFGKKRKKNYYSKMRPNKCCCCDHKIGSLILLGVCLYIAVRSVLYSVKSDHGITAFVDLLFIGFGFVIVLKVNKKKKRRRIYWNIFYIAFNLTTTL